MWKLRRSRGVSPVIATIILSVVVIAVGGGVWSYSQGAATVIAENYVDDKLTLLDEVLERFNVEHVCNNSDRSLLFVWVYNYGDVDVVIDLYANTTEEYGSTLETTISSGDLAKITVSFAGNPLEIGDEVAIKAHSRRQNNAYYKYYVP